MRVRWLLPFVLLVGVSSALGSCSKASAADVTMVAIGGKACPTCAPDGVVVKQDGTISFFTHDVLTVSDARTTDSIIRALPFDELRKAEHANLAIGGALGVGIWVAYRDGTHDYAVVPVGQIGNAEIPHLQRWLTFAGFRATESLMGMRQQAIREAIQSGTLRKVTLDALGCYGACPRYSVEFDRSGTATLHDQSPGCDVRATARVPFSVILDVATHSGMANVWPAYPRLQTDGFGARVTIDTPGGVFVSDGPDSSTWDATFAAAEGRLDQVVRMTVWTPNVDLDRCARPGTSKSP